MTPTAATSTTGAALDRAASLVAEVQRRREETLRAKIKPRPRRSIHASQIPDCARQGVYEFTHWDQKKLWGPEVQALMDAGHVQEAAYKAELRALGFELVEDQSPLSKDMADQYGIHGYIDTKIAWGGVRIPVEFKAVNPNTFGRIRDGAAGLDDMRDTVYMRRYIRQGLVYLLGNNEEAMIFALTDSRGAWKFVPMALDLDEAERVLKVAEKIKTNVEAKTMPDRIAYDPEICGWCSFQHVCIPDINSNPGVKFVDNPQVEQDLNRLDELRPIVKEYESLYEKIKDVFAGAKMATIGGWLISNKPGTRTSYEIPDEIRAKYAVKVETSRMKIERLGEEEK